MKFMDKFNRNIVLLVVVLVAVTFGAYKIGSNHSNNDSANNNSSNSSTASTQKVEIAPSGMKYPETWQEDQQITQADKNAGVVSEARHIDPTASVVVRIVAEALDKSFDIKSLPDQTVNSLQKSLSDFSLVSKKLTQAGKHDAVEVSYKSSADGVTYENTTIIVPTTRKTFYITFAAKPADFAKITSDIKAIETVVFEYINNHLN